jgi:hypothetical protein
VIRGWAQSLGAELPAPYVEVGIRATEDLGYVPVQLLVDTGADVTTLQPRAGLVLWSDYMAHDFGIDPTLHMALGIGGTAQYIIREVALRFLDEAGEPVNMRLPVRVAAPLNQVAWRLPSLLGRDVINAFTLTFDARSGTVTLEQ